LNEPQEQYPNDQGSNEKVGVEAGYFEIDKGQTIQTDERKDGTKGVQKEIGHHQDEGINDKGIKAGDQGEGGEEKNRGDADEGGSNNEKESQVFQVSILS
jgi:hypothetical protein